MIKNPMARSPGNVDLIIHLYLTANQNFCEDSFSGHDAISDCIKDVAPALADLADLSDLQKNCPPYFQLCTDGKRRRKIGPPIGRGNSLVFLPTHYVKGFQDGCRRRIEPFLGLFLKFQCLCRTCRNTKAAADATLGMKLQFFFFHF